MGNKRSGMSMMWGIIQAERAMGKEAKTNQLINPIVVTKAVFRILFQICNDCFDTHYLIFDTARLSIVNPTDYVTDQPTNLSIQLLL